MSIKPPQKCLKFGSTTHLHTMVRSTSIARDLVAVAAVWHALALAPGAASPPAQLLSAVVGVHSNVLAHGGETADAAAVAQEDKEKRVVTYNADPPLLGLTMVGACIPNPANPAAFSHLT